MKKIILAVMFMALSAFFTACAAKPEAVYAPAPVQDSGKIAVVTTIFPLYDFARAVGGDKVELTMLLKAGAEIHSLEPTPADIIKIQNAQVFLYIGGERDMWVERVLGSFAEKGPQTLRLMDSVQVVAEEIGEGREEEDTAEEEITYDEHIWTSPANAILMVKAIAAALAEADAVNAGLYRSNAAAYCAQISALDEEFHGVVSQARRSLLVFGDRFPFRYFADAYGLQYRAAFPGCSTDMEPSAATVAYLTDMVKENQLPYIYHIELSNENIARAICEQTGAGCLLLHSCQEVSKEDFAAGATYVSLMRQNIESLRKGLN